ncbi:MULTISPECIES: hypothetical protein [Microcystis]|uniref:Uncharacterized protein n=2 Tax=Microcystis TaxID=1125 RepID=A0A552E0G1_MICAE|nr:MULTISPECIES: hypothetical protein [Microcystis]MBD2602801.1 hypothetical protein [Microcystis viridis FACHB-1342]MDB9386164.1 hypothetical protein [Microcystis aeruginosa CS-583]ODV37049.1 hypothetical protein BFG60_3472 [Microcystis aeruginosa NIES-98]TRU27966.1 MAG: hypothetical protein EWV80_06030 [Microcystis aeruginosa Ma_QC_B_20070730_S2]
MAAGYRDEVPFSEVALAHYQSLDSEREEEWERLLQASNVPNIRQVFKPETPFYAVHLLGFTDEMKSRPI